MRDYAARHRERVASFDGTTCVKCGQPIKRSQAKASSATPESPIHWGCQDGANDPKPWQAARGLFNRRREDIDYGAERLAETAEARAAGWEQ
jgi:hypothetical protein